MNRPDLVSLSNRQYRIRSDQSEGRVKLNKDWEKHQRWIQNVIAELWTNRGQYPGIGSVLNFLGFGRGMTYHQEVLIPLEKQNGDTFEQTIQILDKKKSSERSYKSDFANTENKWDAYSSDPDIRKLLELLMKLEISEEQVQ